MSAIKQEFQVSIHRSDHYDSMAFLALPADYFTLQDALAMGRISSDSAVCEIEVEWERLEGLLKVLPRIADIYELNYLAERLAAMDEVQIACFRGLVEIDVNEHGKQPVSLERLINMTHSLNDCQLIDGIHNDADLGKFYVENDFLPELEQLTDQQYESLYPLLDFAKIGAKMRQADHGVFTATGYLFSHVYPEVAEVYHTGQDIQPGKPGYMLRLQALSNNPDQPLILDLPAEESALREAFSYLEAKGQDEDFYFNIHGALLGLHQITGGMSQLENLNELAKTLQDLEENGRLPSLRRCWMLSARRISAKSWTWRSGWMGTTSSRRMDLPEDYAAACLNEAPSPADTYLLLGYLDAESYGRVIMEQHHVAETPYGFIGRKDRQPLQTVTDSLEQGQSFADC